MTCGPCDTARATKQPGGIFDSLKCVYCAARILQAIGQLQIAQSEATTRRKFQLALSMKYGLDEAEIRALVKGPMAVAPLPVVEDAPKKAKK